MKLPIAILAGGLATRLHPVTLNVPKALIPINGHPFIQWQLELLAKQGVNYVVLCLGYKASEIVDFVGDGRQYGLNVEYSIEKRVVNGKKMWVLCCRSEDGKEYPVDFYRAAVNETCEYPSSVKWVSSLIGMGPAPRSEVSYFGG